MKLIDVPFATLVLEYITTLRLSPEAKIELLKHQVRAITNHDMWQTVFRIYRHQVSKKRTTRSSVYYECSEGCIRFSAYALCEHTLAVADIDNRLSDFLKAYKMKNGGKRDLNAIVHIDMPA